MKIPNLFWALCVLAFLYVFFPELFYKMQQTAIDLAPLGGTNHE